MAPRILIVAPRLDVGGAEIHLLRVLPRLRQAGLDAHLFTISRGGRLETQFLAAGVPLMGAEGRGQRILRNLDAARALRREIRRLQPDILHFFLPEPAFVGALASAGLGGRIRILSRRSLTHYRRNHVFLGWLDHRLSRVMTGLIGNSTAVASELVADCGDAGRVGIIHNGVDVPPAPDAQARAAVRRKLGIDQNAFVIAAIANFFPYKGHADLIDALKLAHVRLQAPWRLMLIGRDDGFGTALKAQAMALGVDGNILWLGERSDTQDLLAAADLGILASHQEGFSNSLIEMMAQALPVIATRVGGNIDAVIDDVSGRLVPVQDPAALGEAIADLYANAAARKRLGDAARRRVEELFSLEACARRYLNLYRGLAADRTIPLAQLIDPPDAGGTALARPMPKAESVGG